MAVLLLLAYFFFHREASYSRSIVAMFALLNPAAAFLFRLAVRGGLRFLRARGRNLRAILIVGTGRTAQALLHRLRRNAWTGMRVRGLVSLSPADTGRTIHGVPVIGAAGDLARLVREHPVDQVFIALPLHEQEAVERVIAALSGALIPLRVVVDPGFLLHHRVTMDFDGLRIVNLWENHLVGWNATLKLLLDLGVAAVALVVLAPVFLAIALAIKLTERGPVFWVQERMGHDGRTFRMLKFRTMRPGSEDDTRFTQPGDPRCTRVGRFLRRTSLDELPQLLNVLRGEMSLVGPRPERPVFVAEFQRTMPRYMLRHKAKAGITGWAQVNGWRGATSLRKRLQYDLDYLHNWSLALDLKILAMTLVRVFTQRNAY
jgi:Undecaprenyl-phosphate glucose phosphotransferase